MKMKIFLAVLILGLGAASVALYLFNKKVPGLESVAPDYSLTADELYNAFEQDEAAALGLYENKVIAVTGRIVSVKNSEAGPSNVILAAENALAGGINCSFNEPLTGLEVGSEITVKGRCQGFLMDVVLNNCYIQP